MLAALLTVIGAGCAREPSARGDAPVRVAVAADAVHAFEEIAQHFEARTGQKAEVVPGASGLLARQIVQGAPFDAFAAANVAFVDQATAAGACDEEMKALYARGRIVVWTRASQGSQDRAVALEELVEPRVVKISIANPEHAPYGKAAMQALERGGLADAVRERLVFGENVRQALQFAKTANADVALVALSLAQHEPGGRYTLIDDALHDPIDQALVACRNGQNTAGGRAFAAFAASAPGREVLRRHGFALPGALGDGEPVDGEPVDGAPVESEPAEPKPAESREDGERS